MAVKIGVAAIKIATAAIIAASMNVFMQVTVAGTPRDRIDLRKVAISAAIGAATAGAMFAISSIKKLANFAYFANMLIVGTAGGSAAAIFAWIDGGEFNDIVQAFRVGFVTGVLIFFVCASIGEIARGVKGKFVKPIRLTTPLTKATVREIPLVNKTPAPSSVRITNPDVLAILKKNLLTLHSSCM